MPRIEALRRRLGIVVPPIEGSPVTQNYIAETQVPTASASRYLQQLCKHWSHNLSVDFTAEHGRVTFPKDARGADHPDDAIVYFDAHADALVIRIEASAPAQREGLMGAVARHIDRFAFREAPLRFDWRERDVVSSL